LNTSNFILLHIIDNTGRELEQYFNKNHIVRIFMHEEHVHVETVDYCLYKTKYTNINVLMDKFIITDTRDILKG